MNFLLLNKMSVHDYQPISSIADALACTSPKWLFISDFNESLDDFVFPDFVTDICFINYLHLLDNVVFTQNIKNLTLIGYNLPLNGNFQNIDLTLYYCHYAKFNLSLASPDLN
jgi:hypothetical protein